MRERIEMKTHLPSVLLSTVWPMALGLLAVSAVVLVIFPASAAWMIIGVLALITLLTFALCAPMYLGTYLFLPATEYKGARIIARLGRNETEISGVLAGEVLVKQDLIERAFRVCHIRQKGTVVYLRGVSDPERVKTWIAANFPASRELPPPKKKSGKDRKK